VIAVGLGSTPGVVHRIENTTGQRMLTAIEQRFWSKVRIGDGCWEWSASLTSHGYGQFWIRGTMIGAHRVAFELAKGAVPAGREVCHHCDNRLCVRPDHLFAGTRSDNMRDAAAKCRLSQQTHPERRARGERHGSKTRPERTLRGDQHPAAKLSEDDVRALRLARANGALLTELAAQYGLAKTTVSQIVRHETWRHVS
jgi:hypothetical protein